MKFRSLRHSVVEYSKLPDWLISDRAEIATDKSTHLNVLSNYQTCHPYKINMRQLANSNTNSQLLLLLTLFKTLIVSITILPSFVTKVNVVRVICFHPPVSIKTQTKER